MVPDELSGHGRCLSPGKGSKIGSAERDSGTYSAQKNILYADEPVSEDPTQEPSEGIRQRRILTCAQFGRNTVGLAHIFRRLELSITAIPESSTANRGAAVMTTTRYYSPNTAKAPHSSLDEQRNFQRDRRGVLLEVSASETGVDRLPELDELHDRAVACGTDVSGILTLALELGGTVPRPQLGRTLDLWRILATLGAADLTVARIVEPHLDALAILSEAGQQELNSEGSTWGVFAAQGPGVQLSADAVDTGWVLNGEKPWCSIAGALSHALVTARSGDAVQLLAVDLHHPGIAHSGRPWRALGLPAVPSSGLIFHNVPAVPVGEPGWYLYRPGFAWGGVGVAAVWHGAATAIARRLYRHCLSRSPDQIAMWHLGTADQELWSANTAFHAAATVADSVPATATSQTTIPTITASRLRATVVRAAETVLSVAAHGMGPEPLAFEADHGQRVADLELYLRQDHGERSVANHGASLLKRAAEPSSGGAPW